MSDSSIQLLRTAFFEDLARTEDAAGDWVLAWIADPDTIAVPDPASVRVLKEELSASGLAALARVARQVVSIALHSTLVAIDGGSSTADVGILHLVDDDGNDLGEAVALHEEYVGHLYETGRRSSARDERLDG